MTEEKYENIDYNDFDEPLYKYHDGALLKGVYDYGFERPSIIQAKCFKPIADGKDLIAQSQSGSGKTGAFVIGLLTKIDTNINKPQAVVLANTRELASQIKDVTQEIGKYMNIKVTLCVGGIQQQFNRTESNLKDAANSHVLVCTPGRLNGLLKNNNSLLNHLKILIIDEADQLLSDDFLEQTQMIIQSIPSKTQICLFSATTQSKNIQNTKNHFMSNPIELHIRKEKIKVDQIKNFYVDAEKENNKYSILVDFYQNINISQAVIFVNSIRKAIELSNRLMRDGHTVGAIHGNLTDVERMDTLKRFRKMNTRILVATDIIARGIDVQQVGLVINYDIPIGEGFKEQYIHRIGRSGRYGKLGVAINIMVNNNYELYRLKDIAREYNIRFNELPALEEVNYYLSGINGYNFKEIADDEKRAVADDEKRAVADDENKDDTLELVPNHPATKVNTETN
jgi:superfamily II DNA/RNA helicase